MRATRHRNGGAARHSTIGVRAARAGAVSKDFAALDSGQDGETRADYNATSESD